MLAVSVILFEGCDPQHVKLHEVFDSHPWIVTQNGEKGST